MRERFAAASTQALIPGANHFFGGYLDALAALARCRAAGHAYVVVLGSPVTTAFWAPC